MESELEKEGEKEKSAIIDKDNKMLQTSLRRSLKLPQKGINSNFSKETEKEMLGNESEDERNDNIRELELIKKIEAALFISGRFLNIKELVSLTEINPILVRKLLGDLQDRYGDSALEIVNKGDAWKMDVSQDYVVLVNRLATGSSEFTKAEQETLAIIAYKQPMKQSVLVKIRGNKSYEHIKRFYQLGLVTKKRAGHTWELGLSDSFHDYFHSSESPGRVEGS